MIDFRSLVKAGVHFGHQKTRWCPRMAPYIWGIKNNIHLIDVSKTAFLLEKAARFLRQVAAEGQPILWVGTKKAAKDAIHRAGTQLNQPYVNHRWIGGTLSNFGQVKKSVTKCLHYEDVLSKADKFPHYTKKELNTFHKVAERLGKNIGGIKKLTWPIGAVVVVDVNKEQSAVKEAVKMGVPVVGFVDTNCDPMLIGNGYVIPTNDDAPRAINIILDYLIQAVEAGQKDATSNKQEKKETVAAQKEPAAKKASADKKEVQAKDDTAVKAADQKEKKTVTKAASAKKQSVEKKESASKEKDAASKSTETKKKAATSKASTDK